jgi:hypothetical protein
MTDRYARHPGRAGFSEEQLIELLKDLWREGINPSTRDCDAGNHGLPSRKVFARLFGSLDAAKEKAGVPVISSQTSTKTHKNTASRKSDHFPTKVVRGHL